MASVLDGAQFHDEKAAYAWVEERVWPEGPICPHCGGVERISKMQGKSTRPGMYKCYQCRKPFRVTVGTVFEASHIPLRIWLQAMYLLSSSKKGFSSNQLHRTLGITLKSAWFLSHRIREAMRTVGFTPMGGEGKIVEADETYYGRATDPKPSAQRKGRPTRSGKKPFDKLSIVALVERGGAVRMFHVDHADKATVSRIVTANVRKETTLQTDESRLYGGAGDHFAAHETVKHSAGEYVRDDVHTNTIEGVFSIFKRGMKSIYQHCDEKHLHRYLAEIDFRYNNRVALGIGDLSRTDSLIRGVVGKRLTYR